MTSLAHLFPAKLFVIVVASLVAACASNQEAPDRLMTETEARIEAAEESNAGREAPVALRTARDQVTSARRAMRAENYAEAERDLQKAMVNADYAIIKSRSERMQNAADEVRRTIETLRNELDAAQAS